MTRTRTSTETGTIDWLLDSDPAIRWQVMRDLTDASEDEVAAERAKVATEGWGAQLLAAQRADGMWSGGAYRPDWTATTPTLQLLRHFGVDPTAGRVRRAIDARPRQRRWEYDDLPYFDGEVEPCINGQAVAVGAYFGEDMRRHRRPAAEGADGGWRLELRAGERLHPRIVRHHHQRAGGIPRVRAGHRWQRQGGRSPRSRAGVHARAGSLPSPVDRRGGDRKRRLAPSPSPTGGTTTSCARSTICGTPASPRTSAWPSRSSCSNPSAARTANGRWSSPSRRTAVDLGEPWTAQPMDHAPRPARPPLVPNAQQG